MKRLFYLIICLIIVSILGACKNDEEQTSSSEMKMAVDSQRAEIAAVKENGQERQSIQTANLQLKVEDVDQAIETIEKKTNRLGGYIAQSTLTKDGKHKLAVVRLMIPEAQLHAFLNDIEKSAVEMIERNISEQDVTEQHVDLQSRLKAKKIVEKRLITFMEEATATDELLKISKELGVVQEEIEQIVGQLHYLEHHIEYAAVSVSLTQDEIVSKIGEQELNTWEKTKKQFMKSIQYIMMGASAIFVFIAGNIPLFIAIGFILGIVYFILKRRKEE